MTIHTKPVHLPTIDFSRFYGTAAERDGFITALARILHDHGFFYLTGHGVLCFLSSKSQKSVS